MRSIDRYIRVHPLSCAAIVNNAAKKHTVACVLTCCRTSRLVGEAFRAVIRLVTSRPNHLNIAINDTDNLIKNQGKSKMKKARAWRAWVSVSARHQGKLRLTFVLINDIAIFINTLGLGVDGATIIIKIKFIIAITCRPE